MHGGVMLRSVVEAARQAVRTHVTARQGAHIKLQSGSCVSKAAIGGHRPVCPYSTAR